MSLLGRCPFEIATFILLVVWSVWTRLCWVFSVQNIGGPKTSCDLQAEFLRRFFKWVKECNKVREGVLEGWALVVVVFAVRMLWESFKSNPFSSSVSWGSLSTSMEESIFVTTSFVSFAVDELCVIWMQNINTYKNEKSLRILLIAFCHWISDKSWDCARFYHEYFSESRIER